ncbi:histidine kinase [Reichenbachiella carrageenanivorans]|uniref:histidine kinase n=1 Tax=Reichenbachiella carrageenanivorans TaxID=2979869 RepID=A0ABY6D0Y6_9BACT|nr:ATP-binding protein [Reichenbachiella carrageenanivorans]UXX79354.1 histidine kinase [Reichenbachiella carrageenanivorans]
MLFNKLNIGNKLALIMIGLSLVVTALLSYLFYVQFDTALKERVLLQLSSVKQLKIVKIRKELNDRFEAFSLRLENPNKTEPSELFFHEGIYATIPDTLLDYYPIASKVQPENITDQITLFDMTHHNPSSQITVGFISKTEGGYLIAITEEPEIQGILLERTGLGQTGESYIVGADFKLRTRSRFLKRSPKNITVKSEGVVRAFNNQPGEDLINDYRGTQVFSSYEKFELNGLKWAILTEINRQEALFPLEELKNNLMVMLLFIILFVLIGSYYLSKKMVRPIVEMEQKLTDMSKGILNPYDFPQTSHDEIGYMINALNKLVNALNQTIVFAGEIGAGNFQATYELLSDEDKLGQALKQMKEKLQEYQKNEQRLLLENQRSILNGEEGERARLSKEMHDGLGPMLTTLKMKIQSAELLESTKKSILNQIDETIQEVRRMSNNLMPSVLVDFGAGEAIGNLVKQINESGDIQIRYKNDMPSETQIDDSIQITLYRIAQESINNALKHSKAKEIKLSITAFDNHVSFFVSDDGVGFNPNQHTNGNGLRNMKERVKLVNGTLELESQPTGTTLEIEIPIE